MLQGDVGPGEVLFCEHAETKTILQYSRDVTR